MKQNKTTTTISANTAAAAAVGTNFSSHRCERGDASCHGIWKCGRTAIFDMWITGTESRSYRNQDPHKVLASQEKEKENRYIASCLEMRKDFTPMLVYSVDDITGREAKAAEKRLVLASKWKKDYS
mmetsp:Transcript_32318/g.67964  ORF Transcript_32318/g.67964 Transcript_32318/m.67964 type:complete len:126 (+) Transcript_32318:929-1306(+)